MTNREFAPVGAPCWVDLWTSDVDASRKFYSELFGWEALEGSPEFGGYFMFSRSGVPIAGGMGDMGDIPADNSWKVYLSSPDINQTAKLVESGGGTIVAPVMPVADLGSQFVLIDPTGGTVGVWQPGTFPGFTVLHEHGSPSYFELHTNDFPKALDFYTGAFGWETSVIGDSDEFRYSVVKDPSGGAEVGGVFDASRDLAEGAPSKWYVYWQTDDTDASTEKVVALGGSVIEEPQDSPYGRLSTVADITGATFKLIHASR